MPISDGFRADVEIGDSGQIEDAGQSVIFVFEPSDSEVEFLRFAVVDSAHDR